MNVIIDNYNFAPNLWAVYLIVDNTSSNYRQTLYANIYKAECINYAKRNNYKIINKNI